jgi:hypothetical protein
MGACTPWRALDRNWFTAAAHALIAKILARKTVVAYLAVQPEDPDQIYGFAVVERLPRGSDVVHWAFVKRPFRGHGAFEAILRGADVGQWTFSSRTPMGEQINSSQVNSHSLCDTAR